MRGTFRVALVMGYWSLAAFAQTTRPAALLEQAGQLDQAFSAYRQVLEINPQDRAAYQGFRRLAGRLGRDDSLVAVSRRLRERQPAEPDFTIGLIDGLLGLKRNGEALAESRALLRRWPERGPELADVLKRWQQFGPALECLEQAARLTGSDYGEQLVELYSRAGQPRAAVREIVRMVNQQPEQLDRYLPRLRSLAVQTSGNGLIAEMARIDNKKQRGRAIAAVEIARGREREAVRVMKAVASDQELYQFAHECEAQAALEAALMVYQEQHARADQARVLRRLGRPLEAQALLAQDQSIGATLELADLRREELLDYPGAAEAYRSVLKQRPGSEPAVSGLTQTQLQLGDLTGARATLMQASRPSDRQLLLLVKLLFYQGRFDSVPEIATRLTRDFPQSPLVNDALEFVLLSNCGGDLTGLAQALLDYEAGNNETGLRRSLELTRGDGATAARAYLLAAQFLRRKQRPREALALLDTFLIRFAHSPLAGRVILEQAHIFGDDLKDEGRYRQMLEKLILTLPGSPYVPVARHLLAASETRTEPEMVR